ncbi:putative WRKY transcription factor 72 [Carex littledalei]|uniref:Putative WRKY transcription factor 72 n=1 Tax=Carex littledalei TaxID=544730 RepID=A0A833RKH3_9POAL|nr:putative WRKY transcription factor 72 [Carex littledalei]
MAEDTKPDRLNGRENEEISKVHTSKGTEKLPVLDSSLKPSPSSPHMLLTKEQTLATTKVEMGEVREENEKLKSLLTRVVDDYQSLQTHYFEIMEQGKGKTVKDLNSVTVPPTNVEEEHELVSLSLGSTISSGGLNKKEEKSCINIKGNEEADNKIEKECLKLGLDCKFEGPSNSKGEANVVSLSSDNSFDDTKDEEPSEPCPPSKIMKNIRGGEDDLSQQPQVKKARVSVRARCDTPTMNDGCQWRKYGQKIAKGNPCPRAYYRCTVAPGCPVRKQVQRCADDMSILITTYEGTHSHLLPVSATAMASTTSAAASMLMSGSTSSRTISTPATFSGSSASLHGLNFGQSDASISRPFFLPTASVSSTPSFPTITLDLTTQPTSTTPPFAINRLATNPKYPSTSFNFSSPESSSISTSWSNSYLGYGNQHYNKSPLGSFSHIGKQTQDSILNSYIQKTANMNAPTTNPSSTPSLLTDSIAKAITSDPSFQSALAAAITSYVGNQGPNQAAQTRVDAPVQAHRLKWGEQLGSSSSSSYSATPCASSFLSTKSNAQNASTQIGSNVMFSLGFPSSKSASTSPTEKKDRIS